MMILLCIVMKEGLEEGRQYQYFILFWGPHPMGTRVTSGRHRAPCKMPGAESTWIGFMQGKYPIYCAISQVSIFLIFNFSQLCCT